MSIDVYPGYYEGIVVDTKAPASQPAGALKVRIPEIHGTVSEVPDTALPWAVPNFMFAGAQCGLIGVPPVNAIVHILFKHGSKDFPMWIGGGYRTAEVPSDYTSAKQGLEPKGFIWITPAGYGIVINEQSKTVEIKTPTPSQSKVKIDLTSKKIEIVSNSGGATAYTLSLDETAQKISITTPLGQQIELDDAGNQVKIAGLLKIALATTAGQKVEIDDSTGQVTVSGLTKAIIAGALIEIGTPATFSVLLAELFAAIFDAHVHGVTAVGSPTSTPVPLLTPILPTITSSSIKLKI